MWLTWEGVVLEDRTVHCCSLKPGHTEALLSSVAELGDQLNSFYPKAGTVRPALLAEGLADQLTAHLCRNMPGVVTDDKDHHPSLQNRRLLILMPESHPFVSLAREDNPRAHWGVAVPGRFSVAWVNNKYLWWHETLHLFNAKDCYNKFGINKCREPRCVMQASPTEEACEGRLYLCSKNVHRLSQPPSFS